jgi:hypothetical protein
MIANMSRDEMKALLRAAALTISGLPPDTGPNTRFTAETRGQLQVALRWLLTSDEALEFYEEELGPWPNQGGSRGTAELTVILLERLTHKDIGNVSDAELARVMRDPAALRLVSEAIVEEAAADSEVAAAWGDDYAAAGRSEMERDGVTLPPLDLKALLDRCAEQVAVREGQGVVQPASVVGEGIPGSPTEEGRGTGHETSMATGSERGFGWRRLRLGVLWALAASLLLGVGFWFGRTTAPRPQVPGGEVLLAALRPGISRERDGGHRSLPEVQGVYQLDGNPKPGESFAVMIESPRPGFATVVLLGPGEVRTWPRPGGEIPVEAFKPEPYGPITPAGGNFAILVIVTPRPMTDSIKEILPANGVPTDRVGEILSGIQERLVKEGLPWVAVNRVVVKNVEKDEGGR